MGQVITFPVHSTHDPECAAELATAVATGRWVEAYRRVQHIIPGLRQPLGTAGARHAALSLDCLMSIVAWAVRRPMRIHRARRPNVSCDKKQKPPAGGHAQHSDLQLVEKVLRTTLLSAEGAGFAVGLLEGTRALFARVRLFLARRVPPVRYLLADDGPLHDRRASWSPSRSVH
jgi:hypothetical protein